MQTADGLAGGEYARAHSCERTCPERSGANGVEKLEPSLLGSKPLRGPWAGKAASLYGFGQTAGQEAIYTHRSGAVRVGADHMHLRGRNLLSERWWIVPATGPRFFPVLGAIQPQSRTHVQRLLSRIYRILIQIPLPATMTATSDFSRSSVLGHSATPPGYSGRASAAT